jgi:hypothetical protein
MKDCYIKEINKENASAFTEENHIQGVPKKCDLALGIFNNTEELLGVVTFGRHHRENEADKIVLSRFCIKPGYSIAGSLTSCTKYASKLFKRDLISWADLRWSNGNEYLKAGWTITKILPPDYFYTKNYVSILPKQSRAKTRVNTPENMTEEDYAYLDSLKRVYDCGKLMLEFKNEEVHF